MSFRTILPFHSHISFGSLSVHVPEIEERGGLPPLEPHYLQPCPPNGRPSTVSDSSRFSNPDPHLRPLFLSVPLHSPFSSLNRAAFWLPWTAPMDIYPIRTLHHHPVAFPGCFGFLYAVPREDRRPPPPPTWMPLPPRPPLPPLTYGPHISPMPYFFLFHSSSFTTPCCCSSRCKKKALNFSAALSMSNLPSVFGGCLAALNDDWRCFLRPFVPCASKVLNFAAVCIQSPLNKYISQLS
ncbi:hypothetical protein PIB30_014632 [Stylosanthes scabra]|uniref:Uncharacterized protein n=1 Tax=Stylosanthes scabra TaxID=79078 RepID=A0ABU6S647_9FABA|nr:hypothetical protein [Stylosanthes scabra]